MLVNALENIYADAIVAIFRYPKLLQNMSFSEEWLAAHVLWADDMQLSRQGIDHTIKNTFKRSLCSEYLERMAAPVDKESANILFEL